MTSVEAYQAQTAALAAGTAVQVAAVFAAVQAGAIVTAEAAGFIAAVVNGANASATTLADAYVSTRIETLTGVPTPPIGVPTVDAADRLEAAVQTILDEAEVPPTEPTASNGDAPSESLQKAQFRLTRLAQSEPLITTQIIAVEAMDKQPEVIGWRRVLDADPCELCRFLYANGRVYKTSTMFQRHPNCNCQPEPVLAT